MKTKLKQFVFEKDGHLYEISYDKVKEAVDHMVDMADDPRSNIDLLDVFMLIHRLASQTVKGIVRAN